LGGEFEILLERPALKRIQVVKTQPNQGVSKEAVFFNGLVTSLTNTVGPRLHPCQGGVNFVQEPHNAIL
jgi:hypothetical protein